VKKIWGQIEMKNIKWLIAGLSILIIFEIAKVYFIMPFPGSQKYNTIGIAYFLNNNLWWIRLSLIILLIAPLVHHFGSGKKWQRIMLIIALIIYGLIYYAFHFKFLADKMFLQPEVKKFTPAVSDTNRQKLIIGVAVNNMAKAYPVEIIGYHHQVRDTLNGKDIMVTYCTVCRTGRVFIPVVNGKVEKFRLVGMNHFNAMFEDVSTKSWWQQATGKAITGPMKGYQLEEMPSEQMSLGDWLFIHPDSRVLLPDSNFQEKYDSLKGYDEGLLRSRLEIKDSASWNRKSWIVGVELNKYARAYDWNELVEKQWMEDELFSTPILLTIEPNKKTHYVLRRELEGNILHFETDSISRKLKDIETHSLWLPNGRAVQGPLQGKQLSRVQSYQEYWHSWKKFHPGTTQFGKK
jgi:hypothetical protein